MSAAKATGSPWKFPREHRAILREHERVVGYGVRLGQQRFRRVPKLVEARSHDLRLAAQAVRILHTVAVEVRCADLAAVEECAVDRRDVGLPAVAAQRLDARIERNVARKARVDRHRARDERRRERALGGEEPGERQCRRYLGAVEKCETLFGSKLDRGDPRLRERFTAGNDAAVLERFAFTDQHRREVRERSEIARRPHRALRRNTRQNATVVEFDERLDHAPAHARESARERCGLERNDEAQERSAEGLAGPCGVGANERPLQLGEPRVADRRAREQAEAGVDAVDGVVPGDHFGHDGGGRVDASARLRRDAQHVRAHPQRAQLRERQPSRRERELKCRHPRQANASAHPVSRCRA